MDRGEKLVRYMEEKGHTVASLAKESNVPYTTIRSMIEKNLVNSSIDNVIKLCRVLGIQVEDLVSNNSEKVKIDKKLNKYPYYPVAVSAGLPISIDAVTESETIVIPDELMGKHAGCKDIYFMRVNGESMNKVIPHGSLIAVKQITKTELKDGDIVVYSNSYDYSVKRFYRDGDKLIFRPESTDPKFTDHILDASSDELRLHGKVVTYIVNLQ